MNYRERTRLLNEDAREWKGGYRHYDLVKEACVAIGAVTLLAVVFAILFSSPDVRSITMKSWSRAQPNDFVTTALSELDKTSGTATYGPPYNHTAGAAQHLLFINLQTWLGVAHPINTSEDYVLAPLKAIPGQPGLQTALQTYTAASVKQQTAWDNAYGSALAKTSDTSAAIASLNAADFGPVPTMMTQLLNFAQAGGLDGDLLANPQFYTTDYTKILMFLADGGYLDDVAAAQHLQGEQWGMMNETGSFPGQSWLWLYTFWYQIKPFSTSANADILVMALMGVLSVLFVLVPFVPGVRDVPRKIPIYKLVWREHYKSSGPPRVTSAEPHNPAEPEQSTLAAVERLD